MSILEEDGCFPKYCGKCDKETAHRMDGKFTQCQQCKGYTGVDFTRCTDCGKELPGNRWECGNCTAVGKDRVVRCYSCSLKHNRGHRQ